MQAKQRQRVTAIELYKTYRKTFLKWILGKMSIKFLWYWSQYDRLSWNICHSVPWFAGGRWGTRDIVV